MRLTNKLAPISRCPQGQLLPLQTGNQANYGLHPNMPELQALFNNQKDLAVLANVGTLVQPTTQQTYQTYKNLPENLYSHSDQQDQWQSAQLVGTPNAGWAGKVADNVQASFNTAALFPPVLSNQRQRNLLHRRHYPALHHDALFDARIAGLRYFPRRRQARFQATQQLLTFDSGLSLVQSANTVTGAAVQYGIVLADALKNIPALSTQFTKDYLSQQLRKFRRAAPWVWDGRFSSSLREDSTPTATN